MTLAYLGTRKRTLIVPLGRLTDVAVDHPERTTIRSSGYWDVEVREWPSVGAARQAVRMAASGVNQRDLKMLRREDR